MKKALILAYDFPPYVSVGGLRPYAWYKYFHEFGITPVVITRQWNNDFGNKLDYIAPGKSNQIIAEQSEKGVIIRTPYYPNLPNRIMLTYGEKRFKIFRRILTAFYEFLQWFLPTGTKYQIYSAGKEYLKKNKVDIIIATGDPFILFKYASILSRKNNIPWIADYRDAWTQNKYNSKNKLIEKWNTFFEKKYLKNSLLIVTVSRFLEIKICEIIKNKHFFIIPNGYDPESAKGNIKIHQNSTVFNIAYVGTLYKWHPIESFINVFSEWIANNKQINVLLNFYGINTAPELKEWIHLNFPHLVDKIYFHNKFQNELLLPELAKNNLLLLFNDYSIMGTKIYDYLVVNRKILLCYSNDIQSLKLKENFYSMIENNNENMNLQQDLISETNSGIVVRDEIHLKETLEQLYLDFKLNGKLDCNTRNIEKYSRVNQTRELAEIILKNIPEN